MSRLSATLRLDVQLQARNKIYLIIGLVAISLAFPLRALFTPGQLHFFMPLVALSGVGITALMLVGVLLMLERGEGTLEVVLVSPLRPAEYLASKILTVTALALVEAALLVGVSYGLGLSVPWLALAVLLRATMPSLLLAKAAFPPVDTLQLGYACVYGVLAIGAAVFWALRSLDRFVVRGELAS